MVTATHRTLKAPTRSGAPEMLGRYRVLGRIASGGMAEILLAKLTGPAGFQKPVVLKRVLPHLAEQREFRDMFLDEARVMAALRHRNVVAVHELGRHEGELFLVMEYLEGESLHALMKRYSSPYQHLDWWLCAYVASEACAGLHAAHELVDEDGTPLEIVHRDVSPQNVFLTYQGAVKLLDFGVARAANRFTETTPGQLKGKFAYMAPEQYASTDVDRRADIFSLGAVLYEISTARRLFARETPVLTMKAVCRDPIQPPSSVVPRFPKALEEICMRALARNPDDRYQSALEMRRDLLRFLGHWRYEELPEEYLGRVMRQVFPDRLEEKREMLQRVQGGDDVDAVPAARPDGTPDRLVSGNSADMLSSQIVGVQERSDLGLTPEVTIPPVPPPKRKSPWLHVSLVVAAVLIGAGLALFVSPPAPPDIGTLEEEPAEAASTDTDRPPNAPTAAAPTRLGDDREEAGQASTEDDPEKSAEAGASAAEEPTEAGEAPESLVQLQVLSEPEGAIVRLDGESRGNTPMVLTVERGDEPLTLELRGRGYRTLRTDVVPDVDQRLRLVLEREPAAAPAESSTPSAAETQQAATDRELARQRALRRQRVLRRQQQRQQQREQEQSEPAPQEERPLFHRFD